MTIIQTYVVACCPPKLGSMLAQIINLTKNSKHAKKKGGKKISLELRQSYPCQLARFTSSYINFQTGSCTHRIQPLIPPLLKLLAELLDSESTLL